MSTSPIPWQMVAAGHYAGTVADHEFALRRDTYLGWTVGYRRVSSGPDARLVTVASARTLEDAKDKAGTHLAQTVTAR